ncbi:hypothetical protein GALMADRAFT_147907 [Galerina marginata CBS 339.88]|uniref:Glycosyl hydrolase family 92 domain-containing protein n=1 Tax=Galerina marginata (strain CBS 339.88) TaxID=685588 RepID=A0A067S6S7_GALM3|nr:hypothetical protein GALMADRAFT_147907 [Galerina marginata CBS 339.88]
MKLALRAVIDLLVLCNGLGLVTAQSALSSASPSSASGTTSSPARPPSIPKITDPASLVIPFIGTTNGGHVFPGATLPHGMIKAGMDTDSPGNHAGYDGDPQFNVTGFSQLHDSGTGGAVPLSNFKLFPFLQCSTFETCPTTMANRKTLRRVLPNGLPDDFASPGYFSTNLSNSIRVELTATRRTALHRYTFPAGTTNPRLLVDITNDGQKSSTNPVMTLDPDTARVEGGAEFSASFGPGRYKAFTCVDFKAEGYTLGKPTEYGVWLSNFPVRGTTNLLQTYYGFVSEMGAIFTFNPAPSNKPTSILARVGVSFISSAQACANAQEEIPDFDFDKVHAANRAQWNDLLGRIQVDTTGVSLETTQLFYSSLYRTHISPADYTGENPKWNSTEPYFDSLYCNWDTYRTLYPLMSLHDPITFSRIVRGMIDIQKHEGWLPECRGATAQHFIQGGTNGDPILGEFFVKFNKQAAALNVSPTDLYNALLADAEIQSPNWNLQGRQANLWKQLALFNNDYLSPMVVGMMQPLFANGTFNFTDPRHCSIHDPAQATCFLNAARHDGFYEGGVESFITRLDFIFNQSYFESTDEPSQQMPFMYHYANRPGLSTQRSKQVIAQFFNTSSNGLPGNDDSGKVEGAMGSYAAFYLAGMYPLPATQQIWISSPYFPQISFFNPIFNTTTTIVSHGFTGNPPDGTGGNVFVKSILETWSWCVVA